MSLYIVGFIVSLVLAALVVLWIACCMFVREKHRSESYQYDISDIKHKNYLLSLNEEEPEKPKKDVAVGVFVLPSRRRQTDEEYDKRPDYPETSSPISHPSTDRLIAILDNVEPDVHYKDGIYDVDSAAPYHSDV